MDTWRTRRSVADHGAARRERHRSVVDTAPTVSAWLERDDVARSRARGAGRAARQRSMRCSPTVVPISTLPSRGCSRPAICRRSRRPASPSSTSMLERVIEEQARGDASKADGDPRAHRQAFSAATSRRCKPGSDEAARIKQVLVEQGAWSQYLEVGIGPDAEIFTKTQPMASVGHGALIGAASRIGVEQSRARNRARREFARHDPGRDAGQRRQPARLRGAQRAACSSQGQGQQRLVRDRTVHPPVRRRASRSTTCARANSRSTCTAPTAFISPAAAR